MLIVADVMSLGEWISIIARSELGWGLDCSVIKGRSELGYEVKVISYWLVDFNIITLFLMIRKPQFYIYFHERLH